MAAVMAAPALWRVAQNLIWGVRWGGNRVPDLEFALTSGFTFFLSGAIVVMVYHLRMTTEVGRAGIRVAFFPWGFGGRTVRIADIVKAEVTTCRAIPGFRGWGTGRGFGASALSLRGRGGVRLTLSGGKRLLIGSQRPAAFRAALSRVRRRRAA